ncbi:MAG: hypothetical protein EHM12_11495, partial [Dehalococcoidia bacterium]
MTKLHRLKSIFRLEWLRDFKVGTKMIGVFAVTITALLVVAVVGFLSMKSINNNLDKMYNENLLRIRECGDFTAALNGARGELYRYIAAPDERVACEIAINESSNKIDKKIAEFEAKAVTDFEKAQIAEIKKVWPVLKQNLHDVVTQVTLNSSEGALKCINDARGPLLKCTFALARLADTYRKDAEVLYNEGKATFQANVILTAALSLAAVALSVVLAYLLTRSITGPLSRGVGMMRELSLGHLGRRL